MAESMPSHLSRVALAATLAALPMVASSADAQTAPVGAGSPSAAAQAGQPTDVDVLLNLFQKKGLISGQDVKDAHEALAARTNAIPETNPDTPKWKIPDTFKSIQFFGDVRFRYEYRGVDNIPGASPDTFYRERFRYAVRLGIRGEIVDKFYYGIRLETSTNPRSPWDTFGNNTTAGSVTPSDKNSSGIYLGQVYLGWRPTEWYEMTVGRMPMPLYTTPMVWDSDINPEGAFEKFKTTLDNIDLFAGFGQFDYQNPGSANNLPSSDTFVLAWQLGANVNLDQNTSFKVAPVFYNYTGSGTGNGLNLPFVGQGNAAGVNAGVPGASAPNLAAYNENGINDLTILEVPAEFDYRIPNTILGPLQIRAFGDFAYNFTGDERAKAAFAANPAAFPGLSGPVTGQNKAYQVGLGIGSLGKGTYGPTQGLVYGSYSQKHAWELRSYWQHVEQYSLDVNLLDSDFFEGRGNLQGVYVAFAYGLTDAMIGTIRYGHADRIKKNLGTGGNNLDIPTINPIDNYNLLQLDLTWRF